MRSPNVDEAIHAALLARTDDERMWPKPLVDLLISRNQEFAVSWIIECIEAAARKGDKLTQAGSALLDQCRDAKTNVYQIDTVAWNAACKSIWEGDDTGEYRRSLAYLLASFVAFATNSNLQATKYLALALMCLEIDVGCVNPEFLFERFRDAMSS